MVTRQFPFVIRLLIPALGLLCAGAAFADAPRRGPARPGPVMASEAIKAPTVEAAKQVSPQKFMVARKSAATAEDKGSYYTDLGDPAARSALNEIEKAKLEMARAAVALARSSASLYRPLLVEGMAMSREQAEAIKAEAARTRVSPRVTNAPEMGVGEFAPLQLVGPEGLSALERAKFEAIRQGRPAPTPETIAKPSRRSPARDDGTVKAEKGGR